MTEPGDATIGRVNGQIVAAYRWPDNAALMLALFELGYLRDEWKILDPTYGLGNWWTRRRPARLYAHDRDPARSPLEPLDFRDLHIYPNGFFDAAVYDPPYVCADEETEILTVEGWRRFDSVHAGDFVYTLDHDTGAAAWVPVDEVLVFPAVDREMLSIEGASHSSLTTLDHRWPVLRRRRAGESRYYQRTFTTSAELRTDDLVPIAARCEQPALAEYSDAFVEVAAWFWTEGTLERYRSGAKSDYGNITQSREVNADNCERIRSALTSAFGPDHGPFPRTGQSTDGIPRWRETIDGHKAVFWFNSALGGLLQTVAPGRVPRLAWLRSLTASQLDLFIETSMRADGCTKYGARNLSQKNPAAAEAFQIACTMAGIATSIRPKNGTMTNVRLREHQNFKPSRLERRLVRHDGIVWCVTTRNSTWLARRRGTVYFTGNCVGGRATTGIFDTYERFGLIGAPERPDELQLLMDDGCTEVSRTLRRRQRGQPGGLLLYRCQSYVTNGSYWDGVYLVKKHAETLGLVVVDQFEFLNDAGAQPKRSTCLHCGVKILRTTEGTWENQSRSTEPTVWCRNGGLIAATRHEPSTEHTYQDHAASNHSTLIVFEKIGLPASTPVPMF